MAFSFVSKEFFKIVVIQQKSNGMGTRRDSSSLGRIDIDTPVETNREIRVKYFWNACFENDWGH